MQHTYLLTWARDTSDKPRKEHGSTYRVSTVKSKLCRDAWLVLHDVSLRTWLRWAQSILPLDPTPSIHGNVGREGEEANAFKAEARERVRLFIMAIAKAEGHPLPVRRRDVDGRAQFTFEEVGDLPVYLPPKYTKRGLYRAYLRAHADEKPISWPSFFNILKGIKTVAVSKRQRGLCDACFVYRDTMRTLKTQWRIDSTARNYAAHLTDADCVLQQYRESKAAAKIEWAKEVPEFVVLAFDYARQLAVPHLGDETTEGFWASKKALDVNLFGVVNEGAGKHGLGTPFLIPERVKSGSDTVCSMLHHYISNNSKVRNAREMHLWSDSCTGQNKNNIVVAFIMLLVHNGIYDAVDWRFFAVGHSKFDPDRLFGSIRSALHHQTVLTMPHLKALIDAIGGVESAVLFDAGEIRDWHGATSSFNAVPNIRKVFYYRIHVLRVGDKVMVHTHDTPETTPAVHDLLKVGVLPPALENLNAMPFLTAPLLSLARRQDLEKTVLGYITKSGRSAPDVVTFWLDIIGDTTPPTNAACVRVGDDAEERNENTPTRRRSVPTDISPSPRTGDGVVASLMAPPTGEIRAEADEEQMQRDLATQRRAKRRALLTLSRSRRKRSKN